MHDTPQPKPKRPLARHLAVHSPVAWVVAALGVVSGPAAAQSQGQGGKAGEVIAGRVIVMPRAGLADVALARILAEQGGGRARSLGRSGLRLVEVPAGAEAAMLERLARHPHVKFAELDRTVPHAGPANDPYTGSQWHLAKIGASVAWDTTIGAGVKIAILDTGVDGAHPDLAGRMVAGWNAYDNNANTADVYGHGTAVAGTAAATINNTLGVASVAGGAQIMPVRISAPDGMASYSTIAAGLNWAADQGARVANISYAVSGSLAVQSAANYLRGKGGLVVVSAGNSGISEGTAPSAAVITVSATTPSDTRAGWSSYGPFVTVSAPGEGIYTTTRGGGYGAWNGTSFAAPVTAGVVGLMFAANPALPPADVERLLYASAVDLGGAGRDVEFGHGRVNAAAAVAAAAAAAVPVADTLPPTAAIAAPLVGSVVSGLVTVDVNATDNQAVARVDLKVNGAVVASDSALPYAFSWDSTTAANGNATLVAEVVDAAGNRAASAPVAVTVNNAVVGDTTPPAVAFSSPADGAVLSGNVAVRASASDNQGTAGIRLALYLDGKAVASANGGAISWNWNTRKAAKATHTLSVVAFDAAGNQSRREIRVSVR